MLYLSFSLHCPSCSDDDALEDLGRELASLYLSVSAAIRQHLNTEQLNPQFYTTGHELTGISPTITVEM